ncbi:Calcium-dependent protein kinase [Seminavis robusta]|uniref:Calcium-dependent protein kinase n=1 Tax=Seminavis robusta TaxID=568900 RepID=A0A9N8HWM1_9STRA|nr:Calcium-dependent protein kinase [Seminavis robusta]|eukprot:Sro1670_g289980.1 Calcium-dependent protein kinase (582) ;mRNA; r:13559-15434
MPSPKNKNKMPEADEEKESKAVPSRLSFQDQYTLGAKLRTISDTAGIYQCVHKASQEVRSVKMVQKSSSHSHRNNKTASDHYFQLEVSILKECTEHPNLLHLKDSYEDDKFYYIVTDSLDHPTVLEVFHTLLKADQKDLYKRAAQIIRMVLKCVSFLHSQNIVHGRIKPQYILVKGFDRNEQSEYPFANIMLINYASATMDTHADDDDDTTTTWEMLNDDDSNDHLDGTPKRSSTTSTTSFASTTSSSSSSSSSTSHKKKKAGRFDPPEHDNTTTKADVWAIGVLTFFLLTGHYPFATPADREKPTGIANWYNIANKNDKDCRDFIQGLLAQHPKDRPCLDAIQVDKVPWITRATGSIMAFPEQAYESVVTRLRNVNRMDQLEAAVHSYIATNLLLEADRQELDQIFMYCDQKNDGKLSRDEFAAYMLDCGYASNHEINEIFDCVDLAGNNYISYNEFITFAEERDKKMKHSKLQAAFQAFDVSQTGYITTEDLMEFFRHSSGVEQVSAKAAQAMIDQADTDGDGQLSFDDFARMLLTKRERKRMFEKKYHVAYDQAGNDRQRGHENRMKMRNKPIFFSLW